MDRVRKQVYELTPADLQQHPMWEFAGDEEGVEGQDEATVRRVEGSVYHPDDIYGVVRTKFVLADGSVMIGFLTPPPSRDQSALVLAQIITSRGHVILWFGLKPSAEQVLQMYKLLERTADKVFPIEYETDYPVLGGPVTGRIDGFQTFAASGSREIISIR